MKSRYAKVSSTIIGDTFAIQTTAATGAELANDLSNAGENSLTIDWENMDVSVNATKIEAGTALPSGVMTVEITDAENDGGLA